MEGLHDSDEDDSNDQESSGKKKKRAETIGTFVVDPKAERQAKDKAETDKPESLWQWLSGEKPADKTEKAAELPEAVPEAEAPLKELAPAEKQLVERELVDHLPPVEADPSADEEDPTAVADLAIENFRHKIVDEGQDSEQALAETLDELTVEPGQDAETAVELSDTEEPGAVLREFDELPVQINRPETPADTEPEPDDAPAASGGSSLPPTPFLPPLGSGAGGYRPSLDPTNRTSTAGGEYVPDYHEANPAAAALLGGIIGYLIGRRRGRIKTEKKLLPIQKKLEKEVVQLQWGLAEKETKIRKLAAEQVSKYGSVVSERLRRVSEQRPMAPEANQLHGKRRAPERIGQVLVGATETPAASQPEAITKVTDIERQVESLSRAELLTLSAKITVETTTLSNIYETHLIGERGLRRLVVEYLRGGDIKRLLKRELVEREIDFERDPALRDASPQDASSGGATTLTGLLQKADNLSVDLVKEELAVLKARGRFESKQQQQQRQRRRLADISLVSIIAVLLALVIVLVVTRH